jgi:ABC-type tungstate transport system substrate-binding protein
LGAKTRLLGLLLMVVVSTAYPLDSFRHLLFADTPAILSTVSLAPAVLMELVFIAWLIAKRESGRQSQVPALAFT